MRAVELKEAAVSNPAEHLNMAWFTPWRFALLLGLALCAAFPKVMFGLESFFYRDYGVLGYPFVYYHHAAFWRGEIPLWNPLSNCGAPFLAQWGTMTLYPFSLLYLIFPLPWSLSYFCLGHLFLGGLGMYWLARRWVDNPFAASVAGMAYVFNGVMFSSLLWPNYMVALGWLPWVVLLVERGWREGGRLMIGGVLVGTMQMLSGVPEVILLTWLLLGVLWLNDLTQQKGRRQQIAGRFVFSVALIAGLSAVQLLPFLELLRHSQRDGTFVSTKWAMPGWGWANLLLPLFHTFETFQGPFFQYGQEFMSSYYPGVAILALAIWAAWRVRERRVWFLAALVIFSLVMALGENSFVFPALKKFIPLLGIARFPIKFVMLAAFLLPLLAAYALREWDAPAPAGLSRRAKSLLSVGALVAGAMLFLLWFAHQYPFQLDQWEATWKNALVRGFFFAAILGVIFGWHRVADRKFQIPLRLAMFVLLGLDIQTHTAQQNPTLPVAKFGPGLWQQASHTSAPALGASRVMLSRGAEKRLLRNTIRNPEDEFVGKRLALWSNLNLLDDVPKVNGSSTLQVREQKRVETLLYSETNTVGDGLLDFLGVSHTTAPESIVDWALRTNWCPLVTIGQRPVFADAEQALGIITSSDFDPRKVVCLATELRPRVTVTHETQAQIVSSHFGAHEVRLEVECTEPSLLVIAQSYYPSWRATVDGRPVPLWRANHAFQALEAPAGRHSVSVRFQDRNLLWGGIIAACAGLVCCGVWFGSRTSR